MNEYMSDERDELSLVERRRAEDLMADVGALYRALAELEGLEDDKTFGLARGARIAVRRVIGLLENGEA